MKNLIEKRNQLLAELQRLALADRTTESRAKLEAGLAEVDQLEADIAVEQRLAKLASSANAGTSPAIRLDPSAGTSAANSKAYRAALTQYVRGGFAGMSQESRAITTTSTGAGGAVSGGLLVEQDFDNVLHQAQKATGQLGSIVRTLNTATGAQIKVGAADDTANFFTNIAENTGVSELDPAVTGQQSSTDLLTSGVILVSRAEIEDSAFNIDDFMTDIIGLRWARSVEKYIALGNSSNIAAIAPVSVGTSNTGVAGAGPAFSDLGQLYGLLDPAYGQNATWAMNSTTKAAALTIVDNYGRPIFTVGGTGQGSTQAQGSLDTILGKPVVYNQYIPSYVASGPPPIWFGDFKSGYTFRNVLGSFELLRLQERYAELGMVGFIAYARAGGYNPLSTTSAKPVIGLTCAA
jgi:HK97 family phage major capsid protein